MQGKLTPPLVQSPQNQAALLYAKNPLLYPKCKNRYSKWNKFTNPEQHYSKEWQELHIVNIKE